MNTTLAVPSATEELALPLRGEKRRLGRADLVEYFGRERLGLTAAAVDAALARISAAADLWPEIVSASFLPPAAQDRYLAIVHERRRRISP